MGKGLEKATVGSSSNELGGSQRIKTGVAYKYEMTILDFINLMQ